MSQNIDIPDRDLKIMTADFIKLKKEYDAIIISPLEKSIETLALTPLV